MHMHKHECTRAHSTISPAHMLPFFPMLHTHARSYARPYAPPPREPSRAMP